MLKSFNTAIQNIVISQRGDTSGLPPIWQSGLFGCFDDCSSFLESYFCPCCMLGYMSTNVRNGILFTDNPGGLDTGTCCGAVCATYFCGIWGLGFFTMQVRQEFENRYGFPQSGCSGCLGDFCCMPCSLARVSRELSTRGDHKGSLCVTASAPKDHSRNQMVIGQQLPMAQQTMVMSQPAPYGQPGYAQPPPQQGYAQPPPQQGYAQPPPQPGYMGGPTGGYNANQA